MPDDDEIIAVIRSYGNVTIINNDKINFHRYNKWASFIGNPRALYSILLRRMLGKVNKIEGENNHAR